MYFKSSLQLIVYNSLIYFTYLTYYSVLFKQDQNKEFLIKK